jgi:hypothetical protein
VATLGQLKQADYGVYKTNAGKTSHVSELLQAENGLKFAGLRDGRLAFRDQNEILYLRSF